MPGKPDRLSLRILKFCLMILADRMCYGSLTTKLEQIEKSIEALSDQELKEFASWFDELRWLRWDRQIEDDVKAGCLDKFISEAKAEIAAGKTRPL